MKAAVFHSPGNIQVDSVEDPKLKNDRDVILKVTSTAICGSDLHILSGAVPQAGNMIMGHEFMGIVEEVGSAITNLTRGDRVVVPFPIACGQCFFATMAHLPTVKTPTMSITARVGISPMKRVEHFLVIRICMGAMPEDRQNMCEFPTQISAQG